MYIFGMFYCGTITVGHGPILQIIGGSNNSIWITTQYESDKSSIWKDEKRVMTTRVSCPLFERSTAFLKVRRTTYCDCIHNKNLKQEAVFPKVSCMTRHLEFIKWNLNILFSGCANSSQHRVFERLSLTYLNGHLRSLGNDTLGNG